jgi:hypothetical protein
MQAEFASRAFVRVVPGASLVRGRIEGSVSAMKNTQHVLSAIVSEARARRVVGFIRAMDNPRLPRHIKLYHSNCGGATTLATLPTISATTLPDPSFVGDITQKLLYPVHQVTRSQCLDLQTQRR